MLLCNLRMGHPVSNPLLPPAAVPQILLLSPCQKGETFSPLPGQLLLDVPVEVYYAPALMQKAGREENAVGRRDGCALRCAGKKVRVREMVQC